MADPKGGFLDGAYDLESPEQTGDFYDRWAATYDDELSRNGYVTPKRCAVALAQFAADKSAPTADLGCGTGLSGLALREAGFMQLDGFDYSSEMLAHAAAREGMYRHLARIDLTGPLDFAPGTYTHACAAGVINPGHAPPQAIGHVLATLPTDGLFVFSLNDHALAEPGFEAAVRGAEAGGMATLVFEEYGEHIPGTGLRSRVYVLKRR